MPKSMVAITNEVFAEAKNAPLPVNYEAAKAALAEVIRVDECKDWADKAAALRSYARQIKDESMMKNAMRIHGRAVRQAGLLLDAIEAANPGPAPGNGDRGKQPTLSPRRQAATEAGLSLDQQKTAQRVARVPEDAFEEQIESDDPPTITELAEQGKRPVNWPKDYIPPADPDAYNDGIHFPAAIADVARFQWKSTPQRMLAELQDLPRAAVRTEFHQHLKTVASLVMEILTLMENDYV